ncbi:LysR family transcriptional regulator [Oryzifoliimicrobium ureilyticus]|uniref:LysR family transcriptional regulator n=1 Tax=Oryzifoliimicrobium ureilyticus TaxID=3113724 RepID=UPI0030761C8F
MDRMTSLRVFCAVAELKSFSGAGRRLGLSPAMVSKHVLHLESRLGNRLLNRTSRHVSLTETGMLYFNQARQILDGLDEVEAAISNTVISPRGTLRLSAPVWIASPYFVEKFERFNQRFPNISLDIDLSGRIVNLVDEGFDLALRATSSERLDPGIVARPLMPVEFNLLASPGYLDRTGRPQRIEDLQGHALLRFSGMGTDDEFSIPGTGGRDKVKMRTVIRSENETILHLAALQGMGLVFLPKWMALSDLEAGRLEFVLPGQFPFSTTLYAVYPSRKYLSGKVRVFIDFMTAEGRSKDAALGREGL